jgi:hypothetical protein
MLKTKASMENLEDLIAYHQRHLQLAENRFASRTVDPRYAKFPRQIRRMQAIDQKQIDHHSQALGILKPLAEKIARLEERNRVLEHAELMTQAALL